MQSEKGVEVNRYKLVIPTTLLSLLSELLPNVKVSYLLGKASVGSKAVTEIRPWCQILKHGTALINFRYNPGNETNTFGHLFDYVLKQGFPDLAIDAMTIQMVLKRSPSSEIRQSTTEWVNLRFAKISMLGNKMQQTVFDSTTDIPMKAILRVIAEARAAVKHNEEAEKRLKRGILMLKAFQPDKHQQLLYDYVSMKQLQLPGMLLVKEIMRSGRVVDLIEE